MDLIAYHNACPDGFTAAYIAKKKYPEAELLGLDHGMQNFPVEKFAGRDALMVDWSRRTKAENRELNSIAKSFQILDHHKTAQAELEGEPYAIFDMNRSGAGLTWDYLFGQDSGDWNPADPFNVYRPWWVNYVEDRDLWTWRLPHSKEINSFIMTFPYTIDGWDKMTESTLEDAIRAGEAIQLHIDHYIREAVKQAQLGSLTVNGKRYDTLVLNVPYLNCSEVGAVLSQKADVSLTWFERYDGVIQFSLRSKGEIDVSEIAKTFNGGGHRNAAGFQLPLLRGRNVVDGILNRVDLHRGGS